jgi:tripartite-type tricarboxylate transporter receptor subunit TctC
MAATGRKPMTGLRRVTAPAIFIAALALVGSVPALAQPFPNHPIHIYAPTGPGTPPDIISRVVATELAQSEGWTVIVENKLGAVQTIAGSEVLRQPADGHAIYALSLPASAAPAFLTKMPFDLSKDFAPVAKISTSYNILVVTPGLPVKTVAEFIALLKKEPDKLTFSSGGFGTPAHLIGEMFKLREGVKASHVPYAQMPQAIGDLLGGTNQFMFITTLPVVGLVNTGKLRGLAVTSPKRLNVLPDIPTMAEVGYPELAVEDWVGFAVKAGTPPEVIAKINAAVNKVLKERKTREAFVKIGAEPAGGTPEAFGTLVSSQVEHWTKVVKEAGIKFQQ